MGVVWNSGDVAEGSGAVKISLLGNRCGVEADGRRIKVPRMGLVLATFLLLDCPGQKASREEAARFLWADLDRPRQAGNLRQLLLRMRTRELWNTRGLFEIGELEVSLRRAGVTIDIDVFRTSLPATSETRVAAICESYSGDLLPGLTEGGKELADWLARKRAALRVEFIDALLRYLEGLGAGPIPKVGTVAAKRLVDLEPRREVGYRILMQACADRGDRDGINKMYEDLERRLATEPGLRPSAAIQEMRKTLVADPKQAARGRSRRAQDELAQRVPPVRTSRAAMATVLPSLAVLSLLRQRDTRAERELLEELSYDLATRLAQTRAFAVMTPHSVPDDASAATSWSVKYMLEIRALRASAGPAASVRLIALPEREILWATTFDEASAFSEGVQAALLSVVRRIEEREVSSSSDSTEGPSVYRTTLEGQRLLRNIDLPSIRKARKLFKTSLSTVPGLVPAIAGLARSHVMEWLVRAPFERSALEAAEHFARKAVAVCPDDHRGYRELGLVSVYFKHIDEGIEYLSRAKTLSPDDMSIRVDLADALIFDGQALDAIEILGHSERLRDPRDDYAHWILAGAHFDLGDYRASLRDVACMGSPSPAFRISAAAHALLGETQLAKRIATMSMELNPDFDLTSWLSMIPSRNRELLQRYSDGLRMAGFR